ncbi:MAG: hypothetical protein ACOX8R_10625 [Bacillota bacterium]|jgi:hypothetical protein
MKKRFLPLLTAFAAAALLAACGGQEIDPSYTQSSVVINSFTEVAGENPDGLKTTKDGYCYIYKVKDGKTADAAYNLYRDYLDENFTYSMTESAVVGDGYSAVYYAANGERIEYTEAVDKDGSYVISVTIPR